MIYLKIRDDVPRNDDDAKDDEHSVGDDHVTNVVDRKSDEKKRDNPEIDELDERRQCHHHNGTEGEPGTQREHRAEDKLNNEVLRGDTTLTRATPPPLDEPADDWDELVP